MLDDAVADVRREISLYQHDAACDDSCDAETSPLLSHGEIPTIM